MKTCYCRSLKHVRPILTARLLRGLTAALVLAWNVNADAFVYFALTPQGTIEGMKIRAISSLMDPGFCFQDLNLVPKGDRE